MFGRSALPRVDIRELDKEIEVVAELPGMDERDISVGIADGSLTIRGEQRSEREEERRGYLLHERTSGRLERIVPLPPDLDIDTARAVQERRAHDRDRQDARSAGRDPKDPGAPGLTRLEYH